MALGLDAQVAAEMAALQEALGETESPPAGDVQTRRRDGHRMFDYVADNSSAPKEVRMQRHSMTAGDGQTLDLYWYDQSSRQRTGAAALYLHGGGMIFGLEHLGRLYDIVVRRYVEASGVPMLVVDYRIAPENPHPIPVEDCYSALCWLAGNASALDVDAARLAVMGDSAGGGLAAGVCLLARDRTGPAIAQQLLIYPMLDDRPGTPDPQLSPFLTWNYDDNITGWSALLGDLAGTDEVSAYAAPARAADLAGLPDTYIDVGDLDIFRDEDIAYARRLAAAGVPTELHLHPGCPHAFEALAGGADVSRRAISDRVRRLRML